MPSVDFAAAAANFGSQSASAWSVACLPWSGAPLKPSLAMATRPPPVLFNVQAQAVRIVGVERLTGIIAQAASRVGRLSKRPADGLRRVFEGSVLEHFGVQAAVARAVDFLEERAIQRGRNRGAQRGGIDVDGGGGERRIRRLD